MTNSGGIRKTDSEMMKFCRVVCIFFMISVHFYPYGHNESIINNGSLEIVGLVWIDFLGRASVATLSLISGYLLCRSFSKKSLLSVARQRSQALLVPMLTWNLIFLVAAMSLAIVGVRSSVVPSGADPMDMLNAVIGILGPTANESLFFIRDLFVSSVMIALLWGIIRHAPFVSLAVVAVLTLFDALEPVIFRPMILLFMLAGCILQDKGRSLQEIAAPRIAIPVMLACVVLSILVGANAAILPGWLEPRMDNMLLRVALTVGMLMVALFCVRRGLHRHVTAYEPSAYLVYLSHVLLAKFLWEVFRAAGATTQNSGYLVFFFVTPCVIFWLARHAMPGLRRLPGVLPRILTGKPRTVMPVAETAVAHP